MTAHHEPSHAWIVRLDALGLGGTFIHEEFSLFIDCLPNETPPKITIFFPKKAPFQKEISSYNHQFFKGYYWKKSG